MWDEPVTTGTILTMAIGWVIGSYLHTLFNHWRAERKLRIADRAISISDSDGLEPGDSVSIMYKSNNGTYSINEEVVKAVSGGTLELE